MARIHMSLETSPELGFLELEIHSEWYSKTFEELLRYLFTQRSHIPTDDSAYGLTVIDNLDTPEIYQAFSNIFNSWSLGLCTLNIETSDNSKLPILTPLNDILLSIVRENKSIILKQTFDPLQWYSSQNNDFDQLIEWLKISTLVYVIDKNLDQTRPDWHESITSLLDEIRPNDLAIKTEEGKLEITSTGRELLRSMIEETESYIERYDIFKDVLYDREMFSARFGTGHGDDLRVQVFESEGFNSIRTVFMLMLYDGTLELALNNSMDFSLSNVFFNNLLIPVLDRVIVEDPDLNWIIEAGFEHSITTNHTEHDIKKLIR